MKSITGILFIFLFSCRILAFEITELNHDCGKQDCSFLVERVKKVLIESKNKESLYKGLKFALDDELVRKFNFRYEILENKIKFSFESAINSFFQDVIIKTNEKLRKNIQLENRIESLKIPFVGKIFTDKIRNRIIKSLKNIFIEFGFLDIQITAVNRLRDNRVSLILYVNQGDEYVINSMNIECKIQVDCKDDIILKPLYDLIGVTWKRSVIEEKISAIVSKKRKKGFYQYSLLIKDTLFEHKKVDLKLIVDEGVGHNFFISGVEKLSKTDLLSYVKKKIYQDRLNVGTSEIKQILNKYLSSVGYFSSSIRVSNVTGYNKRRSKIINHFIKIKENNPTRVNKIIITGVSDSLDTELRSVISENQFNFHIKGYYLEKDFVKYNKIITDYLSSSGYYFSEVSGPFTKFTNDKSNVDIYFKVHLGNKVVVREIDYGFSEKLLSAEIKKKFKNKIGGVFFQENVVHDKKLLLDYLKEKGFFFAKLNKIKNKSEYFTDNYQKVVLDYDIDPGKKIKINDIKIIGLKKTKIEIVNREIKVKKGDYLTPSVISNINDVIVPLSLFSFVSVTPSKVFRLENNDYYTDLIIQLKERDYGLIRLSPGYRTDLGFKVESLFQRNNILGKNEAFSLNLRGNRRTSLRYLDNRRQNENRNVIEFAGVTSYSIPYILDSKVRLQTNAELVRRRFYGFDADIARVSFRLTKNVSSLLGVSARYQFENIKQYDATQESDQGYFRIGSLMTSVFIDGRDKVVNPQNGSYHGLSLEVGNPTLLSMDDGDLEINFIKLVSRNRLYYTAGGVTFAASISAGFQKNLASDLYYDQNGRTEINPDGSLRTIGLLPSVKVFRLEGIDTVRGFSEEEINKLSDGNDILDKRIQDKAYMVNTKFEVRRLLSETIVGALFFDAGSLFVNSFKPLKLRKSAGVSFKFLTPVGTLDFDYGLKLDRRSYGFSQNEMFGRFHLAIGFF